MERKQCILHIFPQVMECIKLNEEDTTSSRFVVLEISLSAQNFSFQMNIQ